MKNFVRNGAIVAAALLAATAMATPSYAGSGAVAAGVAGGFVAGAVVGSAVANSNYYNGPGYAYAPGPGYYGAGPGYYGPPRAYYGSPYAYEPAPAYAAAPNYGQGGCWHVTDDSRGYGFYGSCESSHLSSDAREQKSKYGH